MRWHSLEVVETVREKEMRQRREGERANGIWHVLSTVDQVWMNVILQWAAVAKVGGSFTYRQLSIGQLSIGQPQIRQRGGRHKASMLLYHSTTQSLYQGAGIPEKQSKNSC